MELVDLIGALVELLDRLFNGERRVPERRAAVSSPALYPTASYARLLSRKRGRLYRGLWVPRANRPAGTRR